MKAQTRRSEMLSLLVIATVSIVHHVKVKAAVKRLVNRGFLKYKSALNESQSAFELCRLQQLHNTYQQTS